MKPWIALEALLAVCVLWRPGVGYIHELTPSTDLDLVRSHRLWANIVVHADAVVMILSRRGAFERRQAIRETWAKKHANVIFVVGTPCLIPWDSRKESYCLPNTALQAVGVTPPMDPEYLHGLRDTSDRLAAEMEQHRDMLVAPVAESYKSLPAKLKAAYAWALRHSTAKWVVKADDDMVVRVASLEAFLVELAKSGGGGQTFDPLKTPAVVGGVVRDTAVGREGKWAEDTYQPDVYPPFPLGSYGHAVSRAVAEYVARNARTLTEYQGEDTSIGIWLNQAPFKADVRYLNIEDKVRNDKACAAPFFLSVGHDFTPEEIRECANVGDEVDEHRNRFISGQGSKLAWRSTSLELVSVPQTAARALVAFAAARGIAWGPCHYPEQQELQKIKCPRSHWRDLYWATDPELKVQLSSRWQAPLRWHVRDPFPGADTVVVVRHPYDRVLAAFCASGAAQSDAGALNAWTQAVLAKLGERWGTGGESPGAMPTLLLPQHLFLTGEAPYAAATHILRYENLTEAFPALLRRYDVEPAGWIWNTGAEKLPEHCQVRRNDFSDSVRVTINRLFHHDFEMLGYEKVAG